MKLAYASMCELNWTYLQLQNQSMLFLYVQSIFCQKGTHFSQLNNPYESLFWHKHKSNVQKNCCPQINLINVGLDLQWFGVVELIRLINKYTCVHMYEYNLIYHVRIFKKKEDCLEANYQGRTHMQVWGERVCLVTLIGISIESFWERCKHEVFKWVSLLTQLHSN